jgi:hypothetical protein
MKTQNAKLNASGSSYASNEIVTYRASKKVLGAFVATYDETPDDVIVARRSRFVRRRPRT